MGGSGARSVVWRTVLSVALVSVLVACTLWLDLSDNAGTDPMRINPRRYRAKPLVDSRRLERTVDWEWFELVVSKTNTLLRRRALVTAMVKLNILSHACYDKAMRRIERQS